MNIFYLVYALQCSPINTNKTDNDRHSHKAYDNIMDKDNNIGRTLILLQALNFELFYNSFHGFSMKVVDRCEKNNYLLDDKIRLVVFIECALHYIGDITDKITTIKKDLIKNERVLSKEEFANRNDLLAKDVIMSQKTQEFYENLSVEKCNLDLYSQQMVVTYFNPEKDVKMHDRVIELDNAEEKYENRLEDAIKEFYHLHNISDDNRSKIKRELMEVYDFDLSTFYIKLLFYYRNTYFIGIRNSESKKQFKIFFNNLKNQLSDKEKEEYQKIKNTKYEELVKENKIDLIFNEINKNSGDFLIDQKFRDLENFYLDLDKFIKKNLPKDENIKDNLPEDENIKDNLTEDEDIKENLPEDENIKGNIVSENPLPSGYNVSKEILSCLGYDDEDEEFRLLKEVRENLLDLKNYFETSFKTLDSPTNDEKIVFLKNLRNIKQVKALKDLLSSKNDWESKKIEDIKYWLEFNEVKELNEDNFECFETLLQILSRKINQSQFPIKTFTLNDFLELGQELYDNEETNKEILSNIVQKKIPTYENFAKYMTIAFYHIKSDSHTYLNCSYKFYGRAAELIEHLNKTSLNSSNDIDIEKRNRLHYKMNAMIRGIICHQARIHSFSRVFYDIYFAFNEDNKECFKNYVLPDFNKRFAW